ncbi:hypothetical protein ACF0H5_003772 [Mactra antiquata]
MRTVYLLVALSLLAVASGDDFLNFLEQTGHVILPANYQVVSANHVNGPASIFHEGTHQYTLSIDGKTCELTIEITIKHQFFLGNYPHIEAPTDTCSLATNVNIV